MIKSSYLSLLKAVLTDTVHTKEPVRGTPGYAEEFALHYFDSPRALTCLPRHRLDQLEEAIRTVVETGVPGDLVEAGSWRGGAAIFMRAVLRELDVIDRIVWVADSFEGLPAPHPEKFPLESVAFASPQMQRLGRLAASIEAVQAGFERLDLLDDQVRFVPGWFQDSLPKAPIDEIALLHVDCDWYESTMCVLETLYGKVSDGGLVIVDDYGETEWTYCREAVDSFRTAHAIREPLVAVDEYCSYWCKQAGRP